MIYIGRYPDTAVAEYKKYIERKVDKELQRDIVRLLNKDIEATKVKKVLNFEELITMDFIRLKSIYFNLKSTNKIKKIKKDINYFEKIRDGELAKIKKDINYFEKIRDGELAKIKKDINCFETIGDEELAEKKNNEKKYIKMIYKSIILRLKEDLDILKRSETFKKSEILTRYKKKYSVYTEERERGKGKKNNIELSKALRLTVCPYCNRSFINNRGDRESGRQFDHFFSKDEMPYFALSLYNLVPSCSTCNHTKSTHEMKCCPFDKEFEIDRKLKFIVDLISGKITVKKTVPDVKILKLDEAYEIHSVDVKRLFDAEKKYCQEYRNNLLKKIDPKEHFLLSEQWFDQMIFGDAVYLDHTKYRNEPLSYLKYDTYQMIKKYRKK